MLASLSSKRFATPGSIILASLSSKHGQQLKLYGLAERQHKQIMKEEIQAFWQLKLYGLAERQPVRIIPSESSRQKKHQNTPISSRQREATKHIGRIIHLSPLKMLAAMRELST